jgi:hypothetical protein
MAEPDEEIEFAERAKREPERTRRLRRIGAGLAFAAAALCLWAMLGGRWWWMELGELRLYVGTSEVRACDLSGRSCTDIPRDDIVRALAAVRGGRDTDVAVVEDWLDANGVSNLLGFAFVAAAALGGIAVLSQRHKGTRVAAITAGVIALMALIPCWRFGGSAPVAVFHRGIHAYVAFAGVAAALVGAALVAIPPALVTPPTARVVKRS